MKNIISQPYKNKNRTLLLLQIPLTLFILAFVPNNILKLITLVILWLLTFDMPNKREWIFLTFVCLFFTGLNILALKSGIFAFNHPDMFGLPFYEFFMWGFYVLHVKRLLQGKIPKEKWWIVACLAIIYSAIFVFIYNPDTLFIVSGILLVMNFFFFHELDDFIYTGYFIMLGILIEYTGVLTDQWHYFGNPIGGVPLYFITLWGGVGFFLRRLILPLLGKDHLISKIK